jgi:SAM-dependent methyltransferase
MRRETTNRIRFVIEDLLPPIMRDTALFRWAAERVWGDHIRKLSDFRARAPFLTPQEYETLYKAHPRVHDETDNSRGCVEAVISHIQGQSICDVGCGTGYLLRQIQTSTPGLALTGTDLVVEPGTRNGIAFAQGWIEDLPFKDKEFDTVVCTHVLEHILDIQKALSELRRICRQRLIVVVPQEREGLYTFNPHFHFFPYPHSFLRHARPSEPFTCRRIGRDIFYSEQQS